MKKPSVKAIGWKTILTAIITLAVLFIILNRQESQNDSTKLGFGNIEVTKTAQKTSDFSKDTDQDGLPDWEEGLRGTDSARADTDGDKTTDGEEVLLGRDPLVRGPNDKIQESVSHTGAKGSIFASGTGKTAPSSTGAKDTVKNQTAAPKEKPPSAKETAIKNYGNSIALLIKANFGDGREESEIFNAVIEKADSDALGKLRALSQKYEMLSKKLSETIAPKEMEEIHKNLVLSYSETAIAIQQLAESASNDKIPAESFQKYSEKAVRIADALIALIEFFKENNIIFDASEPGAIFNLQF